MSWLSCSSNGAVSFILQIVLCQIFCQKSKIERARIFGKLVLFLQQVYGRPAEAITYAERARSRLFLDQLANGRYHAVIETVRGEPIAYEQICRLLRDDAAS